MKLVIFAITLAAVVAPSIALTCHSCGYLIGVGDYDCDDPFLVEGENVTCPDNYYCKHGSLASANGCSFASPCCKSCCIKGTIASGNTITALSRTCEPECQTGCIDFLGSKLCGYCCRSDFCNSATNVQFNAVTFLAILVASIVIMFH